MSNVNTYKNALSNAYKKKQQDRLTTDEKTENLLGKSNVLEKTVGVVDELQDDLTRGALKGIEGFVDTGLLLGAWTFSLFGTKKNKISKSFEKGAKYDLTDNAMNLSHKTDKYKIDRAIYKSERARDNNLTNYLPNVIDTGAKEISQSIGQMLPSLATGGASLLTLGLSAGGNSAVEGLNQGKSLNKSIAYGTAQGLKEVATEKLFGLVGGKVGGVWGENTSRVLAKTTVKEAFKEVGKEFVEEGLEEALGDLFEPLIEKATLDSGKGWKKNLKELGKVYSSGELYQQMAHDFIVGAITGGVMSGVSTGSQIKALGLENYLSKTDLDKAHNIYKDYLDKYEKDKITNADLEKAQKDLEDVFGKAISERLDKQVKENRSQERIDTAREINDSILEVIKETGRIDQTVGDTLAKAYEERTGKKLNISVLSEEELARKFDKLDIEGVNAFTNQKGEVYISRDAMTKNKNKTLYNLVQHELTHNMNKTQVNMMIKDLLNKDFSFTIGVGNENQTRRVNNKNWEKAYRERYKEDIKNMTEQEASDYLKEELLADYLGSQLGNYNSLMNILGKRNAFSNFFNNLFNRGSLKEQVRSGLDTGRQTTKDFLMTSTYYDGTRNKTYGDVDDPLRSARYSKDLSGQIDETGVFLTKSQAERFKNVSKEMRDEQGRLLRWYHGTRYGGFTVFDPRLDSENRGHYRFGNWVVNFFARSQDMSRSYSGSYKELKPRKITDYKKFRNDVMTAYKKGYWTDEDGVMYSVATNEVVADEEQARELIEEGYDLEEDNLAYFQDVLSTMGFTNFYFKGINDIDISSNNFEELRKIAEETDGYYAFRFIDPTKAKGDSSRYLEQNFLVPYKDVIITQVLRFIERNELQPTARNAGIYSVYLDVNNPLVVDAKGSNWNLINVSDENSEVSKLYKSIDDNIEKFINERKDLISEDKYGKKYIPYDDISELLKVFSEFTVEYELDNSFTVYYKDHRFAHIIEPFLESKESIETVEFLLKIGLAREFFSDDVLETNDFVWKAINSNERGNTNYDAVIIKNVVDYGQFGSRSMRSSDICITIKSANQIKSIYNENPTDDVDYMFSKDTSKKKTTSTNTGRKIKLEPALEDVKKLIKDNMSTILDNGLKLQEQGGYKDFRTRWVMDTYWYLKRKFNFNLDKYNVEYEDKDVLNLMKKAFDQAVDEQEEQKQKVEEPKKEVKKTTKPKKAEDKIMGLNKSSVMEVLDKAVNDKNPNMKFNIKVISRLYSLLSDNGLVKKVESKYEYKGNQYSWKDLTELLTKELNENGIALTDNNYSFKTELSEEDIYNKTKEIFSLKVGDKDYNIYDLGFKKELIDMISSYEKGKEFDNDKFVKLVDEEKDRNNAIIGELFINGKDTIKQRLNDLHNVDAEKKIISDVANYVNDVYEQIASRVEKIKSIRADMKENGSKNLVHTNPIRYQINTLKNIINDLNKDYGLKIKVENFGNTTETDTETEEVEEVKETKETKKKEPKKKDRGKNIEPLNNFLTQMGYNKVELYNYDRTQNEFTKNKKGSDFTKERKKFNKLIKDKNSTNEDILNSYLALTEQGLNIVSYVEREWQHSTKNPNGLISNKSIKSDIKRILYNNFKDINDYRTFLDDSDTSSKIAYNLFLIRKSLVKIFGGNEYYIEHKHFDKVLETYTKTKEKVKLQDTDAPTPILNTNNDKNITLYINDISSNQNVVEVDEEKVLRLLSEYNKADITKKERFNIKNKIIEEYANTKYTIGKEGNAISLKDYIEQKYNNKESAMSYDSWRYKVNYRLGDKALHKLTPYEVSLIINDISLNVFENVAKEQATKQYKDVNDIIDTLNKLHKKKNLKFADNVNIQKLMPEKLLTLVNEIVDIKGRGKRIKNVQLIRETTNKLNDLLKENIGLADELTVSTPSGKKELKKNIFDYIETLLQISDKQTYLNAQQTLALKQIVNSIEALTNRAMTIVIDGKKVEAQTFAQEQVDKFIDTNVLYNNVGLRKGKKKLLPTRIFEWARNPLVLDVRTRLELLQKTNKDGFYTNWLVPNLQKASNDRSQMVYELTNNIKNSDDKNYIQTIKENHKRLTKEKIILPNKKVIRGDRALTLYMLSLREQGMKHISNYGDYKGEGFKVQVGNTLLGNDLQDFDGLTEEDIKVIQEYGEKNKNVVETIRNIMDKMEKKYVQFMQDKFSYVEEPEGNYFRIESVKGMDNSSASSIDNQLKQMKSPTPSFFKQVDVNAENKILVRDVFDVVNDYIQQFTRYVAFNPVAQEYDRIMNSNIKVNGKETTLHNHIAGIDGKVNKYVDDLFANLLGVGKAKSTIGRLMSKLRMNIGKASLGLNFKVALQQLASSPMLLSVMPFQDWVVGAGNLNVPMSVKLYKTMYSNSPYFLNRFKGNGMSNAMLLTSEGINAVSSGIDKATDYGMKLINFMDSTVMVGIFRSAIHNVARENTVDGKKITYDELINNINEDKYADLRKQALSLAEEWARLTQPQYDALENSEMIWNSRFDYEVLKGGLMYSSVIRKYLSRLTSTWVEMRKNPTKENVKAWGWTVGAFALSQTMLSALVILISRGVLGRDDDEKWWKYILRTTSENLTINNVPFVKDVYGRITKNYDIKNPVLDAYDTFIGSLADLKKIKKGDYTGKNAYTLAGNTLKLFGIPFTTVTKQINDLVERFSGHDFIDDTLGAKSSSIERSERLKEMEENIAKNRPSIALNKFNLIFTASKMEAPSKEVQKEMIRLYTNDYKTIVPSTDFEYMTIDGEKFKLKDNAQRKFADIYSQANDIVSKLIESRYYKSLEDKDKASLIKKIYNAYYDIAKKEVVDKNNKYELNVFANCVNTYGGENLINYISKIETSINKGMSKKEAVLSVANTISKSKRIYLYNLYGYTTK